MNTYSALGITEQRLIRAEIESKVFADYGIVQSYSSGKVDIILASRKSIDGKELAEDIEVKGVELLFPASKGLSFEYEVAQGDQVLVIGLKKRIATVKDLASSSFNVNPSSYDINTLKAIPFGALRDVGTSSGQSGVLMRAKNEKFLLKNQATDGSLGKILTDLIAEIKSLQTATFLLSGTEMTASGNPVIGTLPSLSISSTHQTNLTNISTRLSALLE